MGLKKEVAIKKKLIPETKFCPKELLFLRFYQDSNQESSLKDL
jgi:hypothetical protein